MKLTTKALKGSFFSVIVLLIMFLGLLGLLYGCPFLVTQTYSIITNDPPFSYTIQGHISNYNNSLSNIMVYLNVSGNILTAYSGTNGFYSLSVNSSGVTGNMNGPNTGPYYDILYDDTNGIYAFFTTNLNIGNSVKNITNVNVIMTNI